MERPVNMEVGDGEAKENPMGMETETKDNETEKAIPIKTPNPFLIDHIVDNIVSNTCFSQSDRLKFRGLCKEWNRSATKKLKMKLKLTEDNHRKMTDAISLLENPDGNFNFLRRVKFYDDFFPSSDSDFNLEFQKTFGRFLSLISSQIESLYIDLEPLDKAMDFYESCYADELKFPKLKSLDLLGNASPFFFFLGNALLVGSSRLKYLYLDCDSYCCKALDSTYRNAFANMILKNLPASIQKLFLITTFTSYDAQIFSSVHLPRLTSLELHVAFTNEVTGTDVYKLFNNSRKMTLTELNFQINRICENADQIGFHHFKLPVFPSLTELDLRFCRRVCPTKGELLSFPQLFPKVRRLCFEDKYLENCLCLFSALFPPGFVAPEVRSCKCASMCIEEGRMQNLLQGFGFLKKLTIQVPETDYLPNLRFIFQFCLLLEELYLKFDAEDEDNTNLDSILTGIPEDYLAILRVVPDWWEFGIFGLEIGLAEVKTQPGLSDLKNLKILGCAYSARNGIPESQHPVNITNMTVYFGIQQLPKFEKLLIGRLKSPLSEEVLAELRLRFGENVIQQSGHWF